MRIRKAFMALNAEGHIVRAVDVVSDSMASFTCHHCDCPLRFHRAAGGVRDWFEHDVQAITEAQLKQCAYFDGITLVERKMLELQRQLHNMQPVEVIRRWHCIDCNLCYSGIKQCPMCGSGIFSVEAQGVT